MTTEEVMEVYNISANETICTVNYIWKYEAFTSAFLMVIMSTHTAFCNTIIFRINNDKFL